MEWIDGDFASMKYNVWKNKSKNLIKSFPDFKDHPDIFGLSVGDLDKEKVIRYICLAYDKGSPLPDKIENILMMKMEAATLAGFRKSAGGAFREDVDEMIVGGNKTINHMVIRFLSFFHDLDFATLRMYKVKHFELLQKFGEESDPKSMENIMKTINTMADTVDTIKAKIFYPTETKQLIHDFYEQATFEELELTPEHIAERLASGKPISNDPPYGEDYQVEKYSEQDLLKK